jgi:hypothetical protein
VARLELVSNLHQLDGRTGLSHDRGRRFAEQRPSVESASLCRMLGTRLRETIKLSQIAATCGSFEFCTE